MSTTYPTTKQSVPNPTATDLLENASATLDHDYQHATINDTVEALEDKVGIDGDTNHASHSYKLALITGANQAVSTDGTGQTLTNITLTNPQMNFGGDATGDMYYRSALGTTARLPIGTTGQIIQTSVAGIPEWIANPSAADASTTVKGVVEEATQAEVDAGTAAGGTSARLFVNPSTQRGRQYHDKGTPSGGTDAYAFTASPTITAYVDGQVFTFEADVANTGTATLNVSSVGAKTIKKNFNADLSTGDIKAGQYVMVQYDSGTDTFQMLSPVASGLSTYAFGSLQGSGTTQNIAHGLGVTPKFIKITAYGIPNTGVEATLSSGSYNGTTTASVSFNGTLASSSTSSTDIIDLMGSGGAYARASVTFDSTNITLTWSSSIMSSSSARFHWEAFA